ncbi:MAG: hypothetical protein FJZ89_05625 [Chloroflexi bacterium]|nr:hypothetical protein [Chloroflexota bacterium]
MKEAKVMEMPPPPQVLALVVARTQPGWAANVARAASKMWNYPLDDVYLVLGVRWAAAVADGEHVVLAMRAEDEGQLGRRIAEIKEIPGVVNPTEYVIAQYYKDGRPAATGHNGLP